MSYWRVTIETGVRHPYEKPEWTNVRKVSDLLQGRTRDDVVRYAREKHLPRMLRARKLTYQVKVITATKVETDVALREIGAPALPLGE